MFSELRIQYGLVKDENRTLHEELSGMSHRSEKEKLEKDLEETLQEIDPLRQKIKEIEEENERSQYLIQDLKKQNNKLRSIGK